MNSLRSLGRAIEYEIERQIELRSRPASGSCRRPGTGTKPTGARSSMRIEGRARPTTATSPSPTSCRSRPTDEMRAAVRASMPELPAARRARLVERVGDQRSRRAGCSSTRPGWPTTPRRRWRRSTAAPPRTSSTGARRRARATSTRPGSRPAVLPLAPDGLAELVGLVADGTLSRNQAKDVLAECLARAEAPEAGRRRARARAGERRGRARRRRRRRRSPPTPTRVDEYRAGDDKVRKKKRGFLMGEVMKATQGPGQPPGPQPAPRPGAPRASLTHPRDFIGAMDSAERARSRQ